MANLVIVAIPTEDDYVNKISSQEVAHMTICFLGDVSKVKNVDSIIGFVQHAASQSLNRFGMEVDRRAELGPDKADTLIFSKSKWSGFDTINTFRSYLLKDPNIRTAYDSSEQFPEWVPHLTLGYPDTPANPDNRDYPGITYVNFDRIAVWFTDFDGIEFPLKSQEWDMAMGMSSVDEIIEDVLNVNGGLSHFGVKGMHWGVRKSVHPDIAHIPKGTRKEAKKDAEEFTRAKLFFGVGAGTRRKLIKAKVEAKKAKDPLYSKAFDHFVKQTDLGKRAEQARSERKRKDVTTYSKKTAKGVGHVVRGNPQYSNTSAQIGVAAGKFLLKNLKQSDDPDTMVQLVIDDILEHHGVKGMHWGQRLAERKLAKGDAKFRERAISLKGRIEVNNAAAEHFNSHIDAINNKPHYVAARDRGDFLNPKSAVTKQYNNEVSNLYMNSVRQALSAQGTNPSGTKKLELRPTGQFEYDVALVDVKHADEMYSIIFDHDENGMVTGVRLNEMMQSELFINDILEHHGVKGMKWGVRRKATVGAQEVIISDKRKKLKATGGQGHPAHEDAIKARTTGQIARKSGAKSLSNAQLKAYNERLNLEQNFKRLQYEDSSAGRKFVLGALRQTGKQSSQDLGTESAKQIKRVVKIAAAAAA